MERTSSALDRVDGARLWSSLEQMSMIGATAAGGSNRQALSDDDAEGRALFVRWAVELGCEVHLDRIGNLFVRYAPEDPVAADAPVVLMGSHLDTQPTGGRFDGVYGVLAALEVLRTLRDAAEAIPVPIEIAVWTNEEGARFQRSMLGSGVWAGAIDLDDALDLADGSGVTVRDELERLGMSPTRDAAPFPIHAAFELHIEQGPVLESEQLDIGVVTGVLGFRWFELELRGVPAHAGPTPMALRCDPVLVLARFVEAVHELIGTSGPSARVTIAQLSSEPASPNTVPAVLRATLDLRHEDRDRLDDLESSVRELLDRLSAASGVDATLELRNDSPPVHFDPVCVDDVRIATRDLGFSHRDLVSGAGHDSCHVASVAPAAMVFVPCEGGLSHNEAEAITPEQAERGASVLLGAVRRALARAGQQA